MKKLFIFFALILILFYGSKTQTDFTLKDYFTGDYYCYTTESINNDSINLGFCYLSTNSNNSSEIIGESVVVKNLEVSSALNSLNAKVVKTEYLNGTTVIYAYSNKIDSSVEAFNTKVNIQIATNDEISTIGWPLILGSF